MKKIPWQTGFIEKLIEARSRAGLTVGDLAQRIGIPEARLNTVEEEKWATVPQMLSYAKAIGSATELQLIPPERFTDVWELRFAGDREHRMNKIRDSCMEYLGRRYGISWNDMLNAYRLNLHDLGHRLSFDNGPDPLPDLSPTADAGVRLALCCDEYLRHDPHGREAHAICATMDKLARTFRRGAMQERRLPNVAKTEVKRFAQDLAEKMTEQKEYRDYRTAEFAGLIWPILVDAFPADLLPDNESGIRKWISPVLPESAKKGGRRKKQKQTATPRK